MRAVPSIQAKCPFLITILVVIASLFSVAGCGYFTGPKSESKPVVIANEKDACLTNLGPNIKSWLNNGSPAIEPSLDCVLTSIDRFTARTWGSTGHDRWSRGEMANFFKTYFEETGADQAIWIEEILRLKQALFGGAADSISQAEIARIRALVLKLKPDLGGLGGQLDVMMYRSSKADPSKAFELSQRIQRLAAIIADEVKKSDPNRPVVTLSVLLTSISRLGVDAKDLDSWLPLLQSVKDLTAGGNRETVAPAEWPSFISSSAQLWTLTLRWKYLKNEDYEILGRDFPILDKTANEALDLLTKMVLVQDAGIDSKKIAVLVDELAGKNLLPFGLTAPTIKNFLPGILGKILYGNSKPDRDEVAKAFGKPQLAVVRHAVEDWIVSQRDIIATFSNAPSGISQADLVRELSATVQARLSLEHQSHATHVVPQRARLVPAPTSLVHLLSEGQPLIHDIDGRVIVAPRDQLPAWTRHDLDIFNVTRAAFALIIRGYTHDPVAAQSLKGLTDLETDELYKEAREAGRDFGLVDVRNTVAGARTFLEATLFTSVANGTPLFTLHEAIEWLELASSASLNGAKAYEAMEGSCGILPADATALGLNPIDVFGRIKLYPGCFRQTFSKTVLDYIPNLPGFISWYSKGSDELPKAVEKAAEEGGRAAGFSHGLVDSSDMRSILPIFQYAENLFAIYDKNKNDVLDEAELWAAFPIFREMIRTRADGKAEDLETQKAVFAYLIYYGSEPVIEGYIDEMKFGYWMETYNSLIKLKADRLQVLKIIANFNLCALRKQQSDILAFYNTRKANLRTSIAKSNPADMVAMTALLRCQAFAVADISDILLNNLNDVTPSGAADKTDPALYITRLKQLIAGDRRFDKVCLPF